jgi:coenzyme Q-binding protein COQ10
MTVFTQRQHLNFSAAELFDLVADVERYPEFMPWVTASHISHRKDNAVFVDMTIAAGPLHRQFSTVGVLQRPQRIDITSADPVFERFEQHWLFEPAQEGGTDVDYQVDVALKSRMLQAALGALFADQAAETMTAFKRRAHQLYGNQR